MKFCMECGSAAVVFQVPPADNRERHVCGDCGYIDYQNPRVVAGTLVTHGEQILLCERAIEPRRGFWTLPAGFMELGETVMEAACRETWEEAHARVQVDGLFAMFSLPHVNQVYVMYQGRLIDGQYAPGHESSRVELFRREQIPWDDIAFGVIRHTLEAFFRDCDAGGGSGVHAGTVARSADGDWVLHPETPGRDAAPDGLPD